VADVTVLVDDDHRGAIEEVAAALERAGLRVGRVLPAVGAITGSIEEPAALARVEGVAAIEPAREVRLPPPDADVQ
jgi:precorrin-6B methylase 2